MPGPLTRRPFADLRATGLLWLINASVLHPRGFALALAYDDHGEAIGWELLGDGGEPWVFPDGAGNAALKAVEELFASTRGGDA